MLNPVLHFSQLIQIYVRGCRAKTLECFFRREAALEPAIIDVELQWGQGLKGLKRPPAPSLPAMPVKAEIAGNNPEPGGEGGSPFPFEFQQTPKAVTGKLLANIQITIRSRVRVCGGGTGGLIQDWAVLAQELLPCGRGIR